MADTTSRALRLLSMLQSRRTWSGHELVERLGVSERTLRRDIDRLRELGYEVAAVSGPAGGYHLEAGADIPPLLLDDDEAVAIAMGLLTAAAGTITGLEETSVRALAKLESVLPPRLRKRVATLQAAVVPRINSWVSVDANILTSVAQACRDHERMRFGYTARDGARSERHVEPHQLVWLHQRWYLVAFDRDRDDWRSFRLDRMEVPQPTRIGFEPRPIPGGNAADHVAESLRSIPMKYHAVVTVRAPADQVTAQMWATDPAVEDLGEAGCRVTLDGDRLEWMAFQLIWLGAPFQVEESAELRAYLASLGERLSAG
ncbi:MAG: helix-turn-helix transcriptional regulator [Acidimicrobiia bacterium]